MTLIWYLDPVFVFFLYPPISFFIPQFRLLVNVTLHRTILDIDSAQPLQAVIPLAALPLFEANFNGYTADQHLVFYNSEPLGFVMIVIRSALSPPISTGYL